MRSTIPTIIERQPAPMRSFRAFKTLKEAFTWMEKHADCDCKLRHSSYADGTVSRFIVNYRGSAPRERIVLGKKRVLMWHGLTINRWLPVVSKLIS